MFCHKVLLSNWFEQLDSFKEHKKIYVFKNWMYRKSIKRGQQLSFSHTYTFTITSITLLYSHHCHRWDSNFNAPVTRINKSIKCNATFIYSTRILIYFYECNATLQIKINKHFWLFQKKNNNNSNHVDGCEGEKETQNRKQSHGFDSY